MAALHYHKRSCVPSKKRLRGLLSAAKDIFEQRKKARVASLPSSSFEKTSSDSKASALQTGKDVHHDNQQPQASSTSVDDDLPTSAGETAMTQQRETNIDNSQDDNNNDAPLALRKGKRDTRLPARFRDDLPEPPAPFATISSSPPKPTTEDLPPESHLKLGFFTTAVNTFGLFRRVYGAKPPVQDPEQDLTLGDLSESSSEHALALPPSPAKSVEASFFPYPNQSSFNLGEWYWNHGAQKTHEDFRTLVDIIGAPDFKAEDIKGTKWPEVNKLLGSGVGDDDHGIQGEWLDMDEGWRRTPISIDVPFHRLMEKPGVRRYMVGDLYHRSLISVIKERLTGNPAHELFNYEPYELLWNRRAGGEEVRVYGELYTSRAYIKSYRELLDSPQEPGCHAPRAIVGLMFWSDSTHLTAFGQAKLWPAYMFLGNNSKYHRCCPTANLCNHVAYFQKLPSSFKDFATAYAGGKGPTKDLMTYCHREVFQTQWKILLDDDFLHAWDHGILIPCSDGVTRRIYPRIFTYSADYPEKVLIACIRNRGHCPCPRCLITMAEIPRMGLSLDMKIRKQRIRKDDHATRTHIKNARSKIYADKGYAVGGDVVVEILKKTSLVPIENAFSSRLSSRLSTPGFDVFRMLVVDLLHEWELGVWKALLLQLIRLLHAIDIALVIELDRRYRQVPGFGHGVIRKFAANVSELKRMAARDYEDLLQCSMPVFDGLFKGRDNHIVQDLLFLCGHWHALAKLRMHTEFTLKILEDVTAALGNAFRKFESITCAAHTTYELPRETEARERKEAKKNAQKSSSSNIAQPLPKPATSTDEANGVSRRRKKTFNMETYKFHSLPDYPDMIREYGTCDSYSTESGELEHRTAKARYRRTDRRGFIKQITQIERRQARIRRIRAKNVPTVTAVEHIQRAPEEHHRIGKSENIVEHISLFLQKESGNPGINDFIPKLKKHLLPRMRTLLNLDKTGLGDWKNILVRRDYMYRHNIMRVNYTSYDVRRLEDIIHPRTHQSNVIMLNSKFSPSSKDPERSHPFFYAKVLGIFHVNTLYIGEGNTDYQPRRIEFLWVRYYDIASMGGWKARRLDELRLASSENRDAFGFVDPSDVLRACHLIPSFPIAEGRPVVGNPMSYFVNRFVDRDMSMRYHWGLGVGHTYTTMENNGPDLGDVGDPLHFTAEHVNDEMDVSEVILVDNDRSTSPTLSNPYDTDSNSSRNSFIDHEDGEDDGGEGSEDGFSSDGEFLAQEEMYGDTWD